MKSLDTVKRFTCKCFLLVDRFLILLVVSSFYSFYLKLYLLSLISLHLQALVDHFGYDVAYSKDWHSPTWYDARRFDKWFSTLRSNRRAKEIMPLLHYFMLYLLMMKTELIEIPMVMVKEVVVRVVLLVNKARMQVNLIIQDLPRMTRIMGLLTKDKGAILMQMKMVVPPEGPILF